VTATTAELNILDGVTSTTAELNYVDGVTSAIQTQIDGKQASGSYETADSTILKDADIGTTVQAYDATIMVDADVGSTVGYLNIPKSGSSKTSSYTLATTDISELIEVGSSGSITIPNSTFSTGDVVLIFNNTTGNITLTCSITTAYIGGTNTDESSITLATRGICNVLFISGTVCVVTGNVT
jgi:hypothetical protein